MVNNFDNDHNVLDNEGTRILVQTNLNAPNNKVIEFENYRNRVLKTGRM
ncbi:MAG: hypothetical protein U5K54_28965 [Cytophagales bacterium]|nr:hypothetical protein [Cytophagales bacterium]